MVYNYAIYENIKRMVMLFLKNIVKAFKQFPVTEDISDVIGMLERINEESFDIVNNQELIKELRKKLSILLNSTALQVQNTAHSALRELAFLSPRNAIDEVGNYLDPIQLEPLQKGKRIAVSSGYIYDIETLGQWLRTHQTDPLTSIAFSPIELSGLRKTYEDCMINIQTGSPLHRAVFKGDLNEVSVLLDRGENPNHQDATGATPLLWAVSNYADINLIQTLLNAAGIDQNLADARNRTPLILAIKKGFVDIVVVLLTANKIDPNQKTANNETPLSISVQVGSIELEHILLNYYLNQMITKPELMQHAFISNPNLLFKTLVALREKLWEILNEPTNIGSDARIALLQKIIGSKEEENPSHQHPLYNIFTAHQETQSMTNEVKPTIIDRIISELPQQKHDGDDVPSSKKMLSEQARPSLEELRKRRILFYKQELPKAENQEQSNPDLKDDSVKDSPH